MADISHFVNIDANLVQPKYMYKNQNTCTCKLTPAQDVVSQENDALVPSLDLRLHNSDADIWGWIEEEEAAEFHLLIGQNFKDVVTVIEWR